MGIRESLLNTITSVADSDFVRIVTSAGASSKATVRNLFKGFESNLSAKSSLTTSDYIRVVGSDNEAYKQSVSSVKSDMGVSALETSVSNLNNVTGVNDLNDAIENNHVYYFNSNATNKPSGLNYGYIFVMTEANGYNCQQIVVGRGGTDAGTMFRRGRSVQGVWGDWVKEPTRAEVDALNSKTNLTLTRTEQTHVNATSFSRLSAVKRGNVLSLMVNLEVVYASGFSGFEKIGTINGWSAAHDVLVNIPSQSDGSKVVVLIVRANGNIEAYSATSYAGTPFFRAQITVPAA